MQKVAIFGARGFARELHQLLRDVSAAGTPHDCVGFIVDPEYLETTTVNNLPVYDHRAVLAQDKDIRVVIGIGETPPRYRIAAHSWASMSSTISSTHSPAKSTSVWS